MVDSMAGVGDHWLSVYPIFVDGGGQMEKLATGRLYIYIFYTQHRYSAIMALRCSYVVVYDGVGIT